MDTVDIREYLSVLNAPACLLALDEPSAHQANTSANGARARWVVVYANQHLSLDVQHKIMEQLLGQNGETMVVDIQDWKVKIKVIAGGRKLVLTMKRKSWKGRLNGKQEGVSSKMQNATSDSDNIDLDSSQPPQELTHHHGSGLILPTPENPNPFSTPLPTPVAPEYLNHNALVLSYPWHLTPIGPISTWTTVLKSTVQQMMLCPYAVLVAWGPTSTVLYNHEYIRHIGVKHPGIMGSRLQDAWPEIWHLLKPPVDRCLKGDVIHISSQELFLKRVNETPQETYFTYSFVPIRDEHNDVVGFQIPNFDNTTEVVNVRRLGSLRDLSVHIAYAKSVDDVCDRALAAMKLNARDLGFVLMYLTVEANEWDSEEDGNDNWDVDGDEDEKMSCLSSSGVGGPGGKTDSGAGNHKTLKNTRGNSGDGVKRFRLGGTIGVKPDADEEALPKRFSSSPANEMEEFSEQAAPQGSLLRYIRRAHASGLTNPVRMQDLQNTPLAGCLQADFFGDAPREAVILPIRVSTEERLHGMLVVGLNTRMPYNEEYEGYIHLVRGFCVKGLTTVKLHAEEMQRAQYLATLHRQQNAQLQTMLAQKTHELRCLELRFSTAFAAMPVGAWLAHPDGTIYYMNDAYLKISGLKPGSDRNTWRERVHPDDFEDVSEQFDKCMSHRVATEFRFKAADDAECGMGGGGGDVWVAATAGPAFDNDGNIFMVYGTLMDISTRKAAELFQQRRAEDAMETKRQQEYFIDMTSHELRNPLSAVCMAVDELSDSIKKLVDLGGRGKSEELDQMMDNITTVRLCAMHMANLIDDVLALSKLESNLLVITPVPSNTIAIIEEVMQIYHNEIISKDIECTLDVSPAYRQCGSNWFDLDPARVKQVLINLLTNAIKFTYKSKNVRKITLTLDLTTTRPHSVGIPSDDTMECDADETLEPKYYLIFSVRDTGIGIAEEDRVRLFERFKQGNVRTHVTYGGNGLGLYICKQITALLGGDIWAESEVDVGSLFSFYLPAAKISTPPEAAEKVRQKVNKNFLVPKAGSQPVSPSTPIHVLLTEDNHINQTLLRRQLMGAGCIVAVANDGVEALEYVQASNAAVDQGHVLDCILMDIEMPRMGGIECTQRIRDLEKAGYLRRHIPIIAVSANTSAEQVKVMIDSGMDGAVAKPFKMTDIINKMRNLVT